MTRLRPTSGASHISGTRYSRIDHQRRRSTPSASVTGPFDSNLVGFILAPQPPAPRRESARAPDLIIPVVECAPCQHFMSDAVDLERRRTILGPHQLGVKTQPSPVSTCPEIEHKVKPSCAPAIRGCRMTGTQGGRRDWSYGAIRFAVAVPVSTITVGVVAGGTG